MQAPDFGNVPNILFFTATQIVQIGQGKWVNPQEKFLQRKFKLRKLKYYSIKKVLHLKMGWREAFFDIHGGH